MDDLIELKHVRYIQTDHIRSFGHYKNSLGIVISSEDAELFRKWGWTVRQSQWPRDDEPKPWLLLSVPSGMEFDIPNGTVFVNVVIRQYGWEVGNKSGVKLWVVSVDTYEN